MYFINIGIKSECFVKTVEFVMKNLYVLSDGFNIFLTDALVMTEKQEV